MNDGPESDGLDLYGPGVVKSSTEMISSSSSMFCWMTSHSNDEPPLLFETKKSGKWRRRINERSLRSRVPLGSLKGRRAARVWRFLTVRSETK